MCIFSCLSVSSLLLAIHRLYLSFSHTRTRTHTLYLFLARLHGATVNVALQTATSLFSIVLCFAIEVMCRFLYFSHIRITTLENYVRDPSHIVQINDTIDLSLTLFFISKPSDVLISKVTFDILELSLSVKCFCTHFDCKSAIRSFSVLRKCHRRM